MTVFRYPALTKTQCFETLEEYPLFPNWCLSNCSRIPVQKLAVQRRYNLNLFLSVLTGSLQGVAERPLPCNYNVIQQDTALSRRRRGFKSRRGRHTFNDLHMKALG